MKNKKILILVVSLIIVITVIAVLLVGKSDTYLDSYSASDLYENIKDSFDTENGVKVLDDDVILEFTDLDLDYLLDYTVVKANYAKNINEIGIFRVKDGYAKDLKQIVQDYLDGKVQSYRAMDYFPEEIEKIDCARVVVYGNYVIYSFLNEKDTAAFYDAIENEIKK